MGPLFKASGLKPGQLSRQVKASGSDTAKAASLGLTLSQADRWSLRCGLSIEELWPEEYARYDELAGVGE